MRVLCFGRFYDDIPGGMQRHVEHLFRALRGEVEYVHLVPSRNHRSSVDTLEGFPLIRRASLNLDGSLAISPGLVTEARRLHRRYQFDLVHLHFPDPMSHLAALALPRELPWVITWHADVVRQKRLLALYRPLLRRAVQWAGAIIVATPSHISSSPALSSLPAERQPHVIPYGFDFARQQARPETVATIRQRFPGRRIFALGRHVYYKGFDRLISAVATLPSDIQLIIGGTGPLTESWRELAGQLGIAQRVHFTGLLPEAELPAWYQACDVFCLPAVSEAEAFGIVQVEAMAAGRPVVSTRLQSGVSVVNRDGETGLLVPPDDIPALAAALQRLLDDAALRERLGRQAREHALREFSLETMGARTLAVYRDCLQRS